MRTIEFKLVNGEIIYMNIENEIEGFDIYQEILNQIEKEGYFDYHFQNSSSIQRKRIYKENLLYVEENVHG